MQLAPGSSQSPHGIYLSWRSRLRHDNNVELYFTGPMARRASEAMLKVTPERGQGRHPAPDGRAKLAEKNLELAKELDLAKDLDLKGYLSLAGHRNLASAPGITTDPAISTLNLRLAEAAAAVIAAQPGANAIGSAVREIAHSFNNLLTILHGSLELLQFENLPEMRRERCLIAMEDVADRGVELTRQLQSIAQEMAPKQSVFDLRTRLAARTDIAFAPEGAGRPDIATPDAQWLIRADPYGFDAAISEVASAIHKAACASVEVPVNLDLARTLDYPAREPPTSLPSPHIAMTIYVPKSHTPDTREAMNGRHALQATISRLIADLRPETELAPGWRPTFMFLHQNRGALQACAVENDCLGLKIILPCA